MSVRLSRSALKNLQSTCSGMTGPRVGPSGLHTGIVHFGIGAFHRTHQAVFTEDACALTDDHRWGILGVTGRTDRVVRQLRPQDCLYGVLLRNGEQAKLRLVGSIVDVASPGMESDRVAEIVAAPTTHLATLTITEKGYLGSQNDVIDLAGASVRHDVQLIAEELQPAGTAAAQGACTTPIGLLVRGLARRFRRGGRPFTVISCDNLANNGSVTCRVVHALVDAVGTQLRAAGVASGFEEWLAASVAFPSTMVDRMTPATTAEDKALVERKFGLRDEGLVVAEPFSQWVIQDQFAGPRPAWEKAGVIITKDVLAYEQIKLRVLNAAHSMLAYLGILRGHQTIAQAVVDAVLREVVMRTINDDVLPTLIAPPGVNLEKYRDVVLQRFDNPALPYTTLQVAMDGSQKIPVRILRTASDCLAGGRVPTGLALAVAAWITFVAKAGEHDGPVLNDPAAGELHRAAPSRTSLYDNPKGTVAKVFNLPSLLSSPISGNEPFLDAVTAQLETVRHLAG